ncbi:Uncharacterized protein OS=Acinetobacter sp. CAG:196 GN=BN527_01932 PE=4 SV=1: WavE [Gemmataceae bacterium]|nr:Uncharacterized protein OS=Acinetobacter sp. CAG:196 GN=BN527_01932 PE=4 SV=1: WavE [Gemmataceae bacterium]VTU00939.1 Uncharacterized protein OS=Acinetobacter sp. CAG:196 GN=BN527_01932 PE=4 SV=1: WavE [Gemmataceae bacterium]
MASAMLHTANRAFGAFSRWLLRRLPAATALRLAEAALRHAHATGPEFLTLDRRAKGTGTLRYGLVDPVTPEPQGRTAVVIQGPLLIPNDFTLETVRYYRRACPEFVLILSTWEGEDPGLLARCCDAGAHIVLSSKPAIPGRYNVNFQAISTAAGIARAAASGCQFVAKTRTDQRLDAIHSMYGLPALLEAFPPAPGTGQTARLVTTSYGTYKYTPFHASDFFMFGAVPDMLKYWSPPLDDCCLTRAEVEAYLATAVRVNEYNRYSPERHVLVEYLKAAREVPPLTVAAWWQCLATRFLVLDWPLLDVYWPKYAANAARPDLPLNRVTVTTQVSFFDWVRLATSDPAARQPPEWALDLPPTYKTTLRLVDLPGRPAS